MADRGELDAKEAEELFDRLGVKLSLTTAYNPEANGKVERCREENRPQEELEHRGV